VGEQQDVDAYIHSYLGALEDSLETIDILLKTHSPGLKAIELIFEQKAKHIYTYRDPRDCLCSFINFMHNCEFDKALKGIAGNFAQLTWYKNNTNTLFICYEEMRSDALQEVKRIATYLGLTLTKDEYQNLVEQTSLEASQENISNISKAPEDRILDSGAFMLDRITLLHTNHISKAQGKTGRWREEFSAIQQLKANVALFQYLIDLGYENEDSFQDLMIKLMSKTNWQSLAQQMLSQGDYHGAAKLYELSVIINPDIISNYWYLGLALFLTNQEEAAQFSWFTGLNQLTDEDSERVTDELITILQTQANVEAGRGQDDVVSRLKCMIAEITTS
jgi:hypothetical protein